MRKLFVALLVTSFALPSVNAEDAAPRGRLVPVPAPAENPAPKRSLFQRLFGPLPTPTPVPRPSPTPAPIVKRRPRPKPAAVESADATASATEKAKTAPAAKPSAKSKATGNRPDLTGMDDPAKFKAVKAMAMDDPEVKDLKKKADGEVNEAEANKALVAYNRALFRKIREIEPSITDYATKVEESITKRIGGEKAKE
jgi:hypothetical protein